MSAYANMSKKPRNATEKDNTMPIIQKSEYNKLKEKKRKYEIKVSVRLKSGVLYDNFLYMKGLCEFIKSRYARMKFNADFMQYKKMYGDSPAEEDGKIEIPDSEYAELLLYSTMPEDITYSKKYLQMEEFIDFMKNHYSVLFEDIREGYEKAAGIRDF